jgi:hypothetical protein
MSFDIGKGHRKAGCLADVRTLVEDWIFEHNTGTYFVWNMVNLGNIFSEYGKVWHTRNVRTHDAQSRSFCCSCEIAPNTIEAPINPQTQTPTILSLGEEQTYPKPKGSTFSILFVLYVCQIHSKIYINHTQKEKNRPIPPLSSSSCAKSL